MGGLGMRELLVILLVVLVVFGAKKLRTVGSDLGAAVRGFKKAMSEGEEEQGAPPKLRLRPPIPSRTPTPPTPPARTLKPCGPTRAPMSEAPEKLAEGTLISHLLELRDRLLRALVAVAIAFAPCVYYSNDLFSFVA